MTPTSSSFRWYAVAAPSADTESFESVALNHHYNRRLRFNVNSGFLRLSRISDPVRDSQRNGSSVQGRENLYPSLLLLPSLCSFDGTSHLHCSFRRVLPPAFATASISYRPIRALGLASFILSPYQDRILSACSGSPDAVKASVPKLLWLSRCFRSTPLGALAAHRLSAT